MGIEKNTQVSTGGNFTADKDYYGETEDGRNYLKVAEGVTIPMTEAVEMGVVKAPKPASVEKADDAKKAAEPANNKKGAAPAENKSGE